MKTIQEQLAERIYEILPHKKKTENEESLHDIGQAYQVGYDNAESEIRLADLLVATGFENFGNSPDITEKEEVLWDIMNMYNLYQDNILSQSDDFCEWALQILK